MADLSKILQQESEGIMFPFRTGVQSTTTEQQVYDSATDGIMTVQGQQYSLPEYQGPTATIQYGTEEQGYPRMLREIEQGELPQFRQEDFPKAGEGRTEISTPTTQPITTAPFEPTTPAVDPCPAGYQLINGVCQPIQQDKGDSGNQSTPFNIKDYSPAITRSQGSMNAGAINSMAMMELEKKYGAETASAVGLMNQKYNNRGAMVKELKDEEGNVVTNPDGTIKVERIIPNPANSIGEVINDVFTAIGDVTKLALDNSLIGKIANGLGYTKEQAANVYKLTPEQQKELIEYQEKTKLESSFVPSDFGNITSEEFGTIYDLTRDRNDFKAQIDAINEMLPPELQEKFKNQSGVKDTLDKKKQLEFKLKNKERELKKAKEKAKEARAKEGSQGLLGGGPGRIKDTSKEARQFEERFSKQKSKQKLKEERDQTLKFFDDNVKGIKKETTKTTPSKSSSSSSPFKRPSFKKTSGGYTRKYTGR